ncbi:hypothetical protein [Serratia marcescens]|uniref:hypothetical protein n=1 Tax=Serratia marcescens TaxID=615 RepID=UPI003A83FA6B
MGKFSELSSNARKAANTFYNWSQLANCTSERVSCLTVEHLKETSELFSALLAELEAKDEALREVAFHVSAGGYNADSVDAEVFKHKIIDGIDSISGVLIKRIDELEAVKADASQVFKEIGNELGCNPDNESIMMAIDALKERLATPVRLSCETHPRCRNQHAKDVRAAGFKVEGDE